MFDGIDHIGTATNEPRTWQINALMVINKQLKHDVIMLSGLDEFPRA